MIVIVTLISLLYSGLNGSYYVIFESLHFIRGVNCMNRCGDWISGGADSVRMSKLGGSTFICERKQEIYGGPISSKVY